MNTFATGICKQEIIETLEPYIGIGFEKEYKIETGESTDIYSEDFYDNKIPAYFYIRHKKVEIDKVQIEKYFDITWKHNCYNTCIRNGVPCEKLSKVPQGATNLTERNSWTCQFGWEVGRGDCCRYEAE
ncbi:hypothetical protein [Brevibacillus sp. NRS-1366]|uniref:hypothetical protein n=1 Tax=Brevibacillus sp. NRS-1366 TaxID=3233899 RepID=UPI003D196B7F